MVSKDYEPFFREGLLFFPEITLKLLIESGMDSQIAQLAKVGLRLDEDRRYITHITEQLEKTLANLTQQSRIYEQLASQVTKFMLSDMDDYHPSSEG